MAWSLTPRSVVGDMVDASWLNTYVRDNLNTLSTHAHGGAAGDGSAILTSLDQADLDQTGSGLGEPATDHVRFASNSDGTLRFRTNGGHEIIVAETGHTH